MPGCLGDFSIRAAHDLPGPAGAYVYDKATRAYIRIHGRRDSVHAAYAVAGLPPRERFKRESTTPGRPLSLLLNLREKGGYLSSQALGALLGYTPFEWSAVLDQIT